MTHAAIAERNTSAFLWFRVLFNSRFYYPVFAILFLDFGVTLEEFALLNAAWAASIVLFEVPSGALADKLGRRRLVVFSAVLMILEMLILCLTPVRAGALTFWLLMLNRVTSGLAEACCSGADESLVYDALPPADRGPPWTRVLARLMRWQSITFMIVALLGAWLYSPDAMRHLPGCATITAQTCMKLPLWANLLMACATLLVSLRFIDTHTTPTGTTGLMPLIRASFQQILSTGRWILTAPAAIILILTGLLYDGFLRLFYTAGSNYYRLLGIPEQHNGYILAGSSLIGIATAIIVEKLMRRLTPSQNFAMVAVFICTGLIGISLQITAWRGWAGVLFAVPFWLAMRSLHYFLSQYLHRVSDSSHRATVLSFKGLTMNLSYGALMLLAAWQTASLRTPALASLPKQEQDLALLSLAMPSWPWAFAGLALALALFIRLRYRATLTQLLSRSR